MYPHDMFLFLYNKYTSLLVFFFFLNRRLQLIFGSDPVGNKPITQRGGGGRSEGGRGRREILEEKMLGAGGKLVPPPSPLPPSLPPCGARQSAAGLSRDPKDTQRAMLLLLKKVYLIGFKFNF